MAAAATAAQTQARKLQAPSSDPFTNIERQIQALRREWKALAKRHGISATVAARADEGFGEARCAATDARHELADRRG